MRYRADTSEYGIISYNSYVILIIAAALAESLWAPRGERLQSKCCTPALKTAPDCTSIEPTTLPGWMALMSKTSAEFTTLTRGCSRSYVEGLYHRYVLSRRTEHFSDALLSLEALRKTVLRCHNAVLQLAGVGKELRKVQVLDKDIGEVLSSLEDLLCYAIEGYSEATEMYAKGRLMYQTSLTFGS